jgi:chorismate mutase/prephenate dehydratase
MDLSEFRKRIDALDLEIVRLISERAECARQIGERKAKADRTTYAPDRERQVLDRVARANHGPLSDRAIQAIYREIISSCRALEESLTVAYWGPAASNTHVAARQRFGSQAEYLETETLAEVFAEVARGHADYGVVPVENSTEGVVAGTLDTFLQYELQICAETFVPIHHNLLSHAESLAEVKRIYTMFQATGQCRNWLNRHARDVPLVEASTTARGAELASREPDSAAIANTAAAELYGLGILASNIEDNPRNRTRFWVIGKMRSAPTGHDKSSILFSVPHRPGALVRALEAFADHAVTLTFIESRPTKQTPWEYVFFVDAVGHERDQNNTSLHDALERLRQESVLVRVLGSYPGAEDS